MAHDNPESKCPRCGTAVAADAPEGLCPRCLIALNFVTDTEMRGEGVGPNGTQVVKPPVASTPSPEFLAPHFPQLEVLELLGQGGMGAVYKVRQPKLDRFVALKILLRRGEAVRGDRGFGERFAREARALARLNHPNIVAVYDYGEAAGYPFLIMEYVEGLTLRQLLQRGKLSPEEALAIVPKVCEALQYAHSKGIVHRDIKPENILMDTAGQVKITDFGIAKVIVPGVADRTLTGAQDVVGTPHYMAPEQVEQPTKVDHRADIYSLGVVFYEMLTGELPLGKFQPPSNKAQIDVRLDEVVLRALAKEPERRYQQASEVKNDIETIATSTDQARAASSSSSQPPTSASTPARSFVGAKNASTPATQSQLPLRLCPAALAGAGMAWFVPFSFLLTPALGWIAVRQIRHSAGRLCGLRLAVFDGLLFPLLALDALIVLASLGVVRLVSGHWLSHQGSLFGDASEAVIYLALMVAILALIDFVIIRRVWRAVNRPMETATGPVQVSPQPPASGTAGAAKGMFSGTSRAVPFKRHKRIRKWAAIAVLGALTAGAGVLVWLQRPGRFDAPVAAESPNSDRRDDFVRSMQVMVQQQVETKVSILKPRLRLSTDQERVIRDLLGKKFGLASELSVSMTTGGLTEEAMATADRSMRELDQQLKAAMTPRQWAEYETAQVDERRIQAQLAANVEVLELQPVLQLTQSQRDQFRQILTRLHEQQLASSYEGLKVPLDWEKQLADIKHALQPSLTPEQIRSLEKWLDLQRTSIKATLRHQ